MVRGRKIYGVFGFCDIRRFTDATECLKEDVMVFTNKIGAIVHQAVHDHQGSANKNIGDAFLLVWKIQTATKEEKKLESILDKKPSHLINGSSGREQMQSLTGSAAALQDNDGSDWSCDGKPTMADNALMAFMRCIIDIRNSEQLEPYRDNKLLMQRFTFPYTVQMGYGLHVGWAIEGAIGSLYKIDASYLAPDVNMSSRLEAATKQFGVPLLMSHTFNNMLSAKIQKFTRCIDCVTVKGSVEALGLYTCDVTNDRVLSFDGVDDFSSLQEGLSKSFGPTFSAGLEAYFSGDWTSAKEMLTAANKIKKKDGPVQTLMGVMSKHNFVAPDDWEGYRALTEK